MSVSNKKRRLGRSHLTSDHGCSLIRTAAIYFKLIRFRPVIPGLILCLLFLSMVGCGYHLAGRGSFPSGINTVCIPIFKNHTSQTGFENVFTNAIIYEFTRRGSVTIVPEEAAGAILRGAITSLSTETASHKQEYLASERRVRLLIALRLTGKDGAIIWSSDTIKGKEVYLVADAEQQTQKNKKAALERLSKQLAESIYNQITANF